MLIVTTAQFIKFRLIRLNSFQVKQALDSDGRIPVAQVWCDSEVLSDAINKPAKSDTLYQANIQHFSHVSEKKIDKMTAKSRVFQ